MATILRRGRNRAVDTPAEPPMEASSVKRVRKVMADKGITAASTLIDLADERENLRAAAIQRKRPFQWQRDAARHYDEVSELRSGCRWMADAQSRMRLYAAVQPDDPEQPPVGVDVAAADKVNKVTPEEAAAASAIVDRFQGIDGDIREIQRTAGLNIFLQGEIWLVGTEEPDLINDENPDGTNWRAVSTQELKVTPNGRWAIQPWENAYTDELEFLDPDNTMLIRAFRRHPVWRQWPDAGMRPGNVICETLLLATQALMAALSSQLSAGILPIPDDIDIEPDSDDEVEQNADATTILMRRMIEHFTTPIKDPRSAAAYAPYLLSLPKDLIGVIKQIEIARKIDPMLSSWVEQLIHRLAIAVDMPPELLTGRADINHWNAWIIDEDGVRMHVEPYTHILTDAITSKLLVPSLRLMGIPDADRFLIWWDPADVMAHPNQEQHVVDAYDRGEASPRALRTALRIPEEDAPTDAERKSMLEWKQGGAQDPSATPVNAGPSPREIGPQIPAARGPKFGLLASGAPRSKFAFRLGRSLARVESTLMRDIMVRCDADVRRAVERAANKVRTAATKGKTNAQASRWLAEHGGIEELAKLLGRDQVQSLGLTDDQLFAGNFDTTKSFYLQRVAQARTEAFQALNDQGIDTDDDDIADFQAQSQDNDAEGWAMLAAVLVAIAAGYLFGSPHDTTLPTEEFIADEGVTTPSLLVQAKDVRESLSKSGGGTPLDNPKLMGLLAGAAFTEFMEEIPGFSRNEFFWQVGAPKYPFDPHQQLESEEDAEPYTSWHDDRLAAPPDEWPYVTFYFPGDHDTCQCVAVPTGDYELPEHGKVAGDFIPVGAEDNETADD